MRPTARPIAWLAADAWWTTALAVAEVVLRLVYRIRAVDLDRIPSEGPVVIASNHVSPVDPFVLGLAVSHRLRRIRFLTGQEFFAWPLAGFALRRMGMIPVRRSSRDEGPELGDPLAGAASALARGELLGIFPEGKLGDGVELLPAYPGAARIALQHRVMVVPVAIWGAQRRWPRGGIRLRRPLRPRVAIAAGRPIEPHGDPASPDDVQRLTAEVMDAIASLVAVATASAS